MRTDFIIQGRLLRAPDLAEIQTLLLEHRSWHRTGLSRELCERWEWRNEAGQLKDMACRSLLLKLQDRGWIELPARQRASVNGSRNRNPVTVLLDESPCHNSLEALRPLRVDRVTPGSPQAGLFQFLLSRYHYLSHRNCVGENLKYLAGLRHLEQPFEGAFGIRSNAATEGKEIGIMTCLERRKADILNGQVKSGGGRGFRTR